MQSFADYAVANINGRTKDLSGNDLNVDQRYGYQCMDLWIWFRYRLGFMDNLPTPDAAAVWEMNWTAPTNRMWEFFDAITPEKTAVAGDIGIMNRNFFGNGVGHIFMILADLGNSIRVLELNGLGDGFEDDNGRQYGSPGRIHEWPKTYLYGYLRWIGTPPAVAGQSSNIAPIPTAPITEEGFLMALSDAEQTELLANVRTLVKAQVWEERLDKGMNEKLDEVVGNARKTVYGLGDVKASIAKLPARDIAAAIPDNLAQQVVDALAARLAK
ncbi:MAG: hypothetical protein Q4P23_03475 [Micrococcaceae bacterium]|nr:hypothetical protein [Micrococcaceae bacterium]